MGPERTHVHRIRAHAARDPHHPAIVFGGQRLSYGELVSRADELSATLVTHALGPGSRAAILIESGFDVLVSWLAVGALGATAVVLDPDADGGRLDDLAETAGAAVVVTSDALEERAGRVAETVVVCGRPHGSRAIGAARYVEPETDAAAWFTSGTTGRPKGVCHSYGAVLAHHRVGEAGMGLRRDDRVLCPLPLDAGFGIMTVAGLTLYCGATLSLIERFHPAIAVQVMRDEAITALAGVPTMFAMIATYLGERPEPVPRAVAWSSGSTLDPRVIADYEQATGGEMLGMYGLSELLIPAIEPRGSEHLEGSVGRLCPGFEARTVSAEGELLDPGVEGELVMRGPTMMSRYLGAPELTRERIVDGWLHTGDLGYLDDAEHLHITGRLSEMIIRGGANVAPAEVEGALQEHPDVLEVGVVGVPDPTFGQRIKACVVPRPGVDVARLQPELERTALQRLGKNKRPEVFRFPDALPRNPVGKVVRGALVEL